MRDRVGLRQAQTSEDKDRTASGQDEAMLKVQADTAGGELRQMFQGKGRKAGVLQGMLQEDVALVEREAP